jgi:hypothetical protein
MKTDTACSNRAGRWFGAGYMMSPNSLSGRLAGNLPGILLWLAVVPLAALGQANYATPYTFITLAGKAGYSGSVDGTDSDARFYYPVGTAVDSAGNVYVADTENHTIRKVTPLGTSWAVTTLAGRAGSAGSADGTNSDARFDAPYGVAVDNAGNVYVADATNNTVRMITPAGMVTTLAGRAGSAGSADGTNSAARFYLPCSVAVDRAGDVFVVDNGNSTLRKVTAVGTNWVVTTLAGLAGTSGSADGTNSAARFYAPSGLAADAVGNLYVVDLGNNTIRKVTSVGTNWVVTTLTGLAGTSGSADGTNSAARFNQPWGVAVDSAGTVYVGDQSNNTIRKLTSVGTNWVVTTLAGLAGVIGSADGTESGARFHDPCGVALDSVGNLYVGDISNHTIRKGMPANSVPPPLLQPHNLSPDQFGVGITGLPGLAVNIESSTDLSTWHLADTKVLYGGTNYYSVSPGPALGAQFYRAHVR